MVKMIAFHSTPGNNALPASKKQRRVRANPTFEKWRLALRPSLSAHHDGACH